MTVHTLFGDKATGLDRSVTGILFGQDHAVAYLNQTHSAEVMVIADRRQDMSQAADAVVTRLPGLALAVKTADCAPLLLWDEKAGMIAAVHSGWPGTLQNITANCITAMVAQGADHARIKGAIGPCLQQHNFPVGADIYEKFRLANSAYTDFFKPSQAEPSKYLLDNTGLILWQLKRCGVRAIQVDSSCTVDLSDRYYSYRSRHIDPVHDQMRNVSLIWMD